VSGADARLAAAPAASVTRAAATQRVVDDAPLPPALFAPPLVGVRHGAAAASPAHVPARLLLQRVASHATCAICLDVAVAPHTLPCTHSFCGACLARLLAAPGAIACPACRAPAGVPRYERALDGVLTALYAAAHHADDDADAEARGRRQREWEAAEAATRAAWRANPRLVDVSHASPALTPTAAAVVAAEARVAAIGRMGGSCSKLSRPSKCRRPCWLPASQQRPCAKRC
jgi:hypothetical protein